MEFRRVLFRSQVLSEGRAESVVAELVARGVDAVRLQAHGYGDSQPVADNGTEAGRAQNRRVELVTIGRASCRERVCQYVSISVDAGSVKKKCIYIKAQGKLDN